MSQMMTTTFNDTYEIKGVIGKGGMSTVYLAEHKRLHTRWAVKEVAKAQGAKFDFLAESNILKKLQHPMLPRIVDIFEDEGHIYIVEDFVDGVTLESFLREHQRVAQEQALGWFQALCSVLAYLHGQKPHPIIYRDMKPSNVIIQLDGSLAETYRDSGQYTQSIQLIQEALARTDLAQGSLQNSVFYEMLGAAYYNGVRWSGAGTGMT